MTYKTTLGLIICRFTELSHPHPTRSSADESTRKQILDLCQNQLELDLMDSVISTAHRIFSNDRDKHRPIMVRFMSTLVFGARKVLRLLFHPHSRRLRR